MSDARRNPLPDDDSLRSQAHDASETDEESTEAPTGIWSSACVSGEQGDPESDEIFESSEEDRSTS